MKNKGVQLLIDRIIQIIHDGESIIGSRTSGKVDFAATKAFAASSLAIVDKIFSKNHPYYEMIFYYRFTADVDGVKVIIGVLNNIIKDIELSIYQDFKDLVSAEVFSDFLEMAEYLINQKYKDAAAVIIGGVLEQHLRALCNKHKIEITMTDKNGKITPLTASPLNQELYKRNIYDKLIYKNIESWIELRNNASHAAYDKYDLDDVKNMFSAVRKFITDSLNDL